MFSREWSERPKTIVFALIVAGVVGVVYSEKRRTRYSTATLVSECC